MWNPGALSKNTKCPPCKVEPSRFKVNLHEVDKRSSRQGKKREDIVMRIILCVEDYSRVDYFAMLSNTGNMHN